LDRKELQNLIQGVVVTTPTPMDEDYNIDLGRTAEITRWWVDEGLGTNTAPLKVCAAGGEGPDLTDDEWEGVIRTTIDAAGPDAVVTCALKPKNTLHTIEDAKKAQDLGIVGLQIDLPFFHHPTQDDYVRYFGDISDAIEIGIMIYNTFWFGAPPITPETMLRLKDSEHVVAVKYGVPPDGDYDEMQQYSHIFNVINNGGRPVRCHQLGGRGFITSTATAEASHELKVWELLEEKRYDEAQAEIDKVQGALRDWRAKATAESGGYQHLKAYMTVIGRDVGKTRPPSQWPSDKLMDELHGIIRDLGWPVYQP
jgi:dihydrodipicolinate synthase/N-acetylneuraminate lyase